MAWAYLTIAQKQSFKTQARQIIKALLTLKGPHQYVMVDPNPARKKGISQEEEDILLSGSTDETELGFAHNDLTPDNIIVKDDKIVGIIDWEMAGFFGDRAAKVHRKYRTPSPRPREDYLRLELSEEKLDDLTFWNDLYDLE